MNAATSTVTLAGAITRAPDGSLRPAPPEDIGINDLPIPNGYILNITRFHLALILGISVTAGFFVLLFAATMATEWYSPRVERGSSKSEKTAPVDGACELARANDENQPGEVKPPGVGTAQSVGKSEGVIVTEENVVRSSEN